MNTKLDFSLYLITDSEIVKKTGIFELEEIVEEAIKGGATIVQIREKNIDAKEFISKGKQLLRITRRYRIPLIGMNN